MSSSAPPSVSLSLVALAQEALAIEKKQNRNLDLLKNPREKTESWRTKWHYLINVREEPLTNLTLVAPSRPMGWLKMYLANNRGNSFLLFWSTNFTWNQATIDQASKSASQKASTTKETATKQTKQTGTWFLPVGMFFKKNNIPRHTVCDDKLPNSNPRFIAVWKVQVQQKLPGRQLHVLLTCFVGLCEGNQLAGAQGQGDLSKFTWKAVRSQWLLPKEIT